MIKAIFFDFYNTIAKFNPSREELQVTACETFGIRVIQQGIIKGYGMADSYMAEQVSMKPLRSMTVKELDEFFAEYQTLILKGSEIAVDKSIALAIVTELRKLPKGFSLFEDVIPVLNKLKQEGFKLGLISNNEGHMQTIIESVGLYDAMDVFINAEQVSRGKPYPEIFLEALNRAEVEPNESVYIGDQYGTDIKGSRNVGMLPVLIDRDDIYPGYVASSRIVTLSEIFELLDTWNHN